MTARTAFVTRERELTRLDRFLDLALAGEGQVCFVSGEAGSGKTALVTEFARKAQEVHRDLVVAFGQCNAHTGKGDPYLPFREILQQLTGDVEEELARGTITEENANRLRRLLSLSGRALLELGPNLIGLFLPGAGLVAKLAAFAIDESELGRRLQELLDRHRERKAPAPLDVEQSHIFEQYANVLQRLAQKVPLILILDDLHWTDVASAELLFHLGRRIRESRLLIVGTYRPDEIALGRLSTSTGQIERHPMDKTISEFKRYFGEVFVELGQEEEEERRRFVEAFLDTEPNQLGEGFRWALLKHTDGHPLFTIELLRDMQERGDLVCDEQGLWIEGPELDWDDLPARVEGVIEERIGRLSDELREELTVGSVEGESFTTEVIARVQKTNARQLFRRFSRELERRHRLIQTQGVRQIEGQRLFLFRFSHSLFQVYLYHELSETEQMCLHEDVGNVLEALYGDRADEIAVLLARHFEEAGIQEKACHYLYRAGEQAAANYANTEAVEFFSRALELISADMLEERCALLLARERVYELLGQREAQEDDLASLEALAKAQDDDQLRAETSLRLARFRRVTGRLDAAVEAAQAAIGLARNTQDVRREAAGYLEWGHALQDQAQYEQAEHQFEKTLSLTRSRLAQEPIAQQVRNSVEWGALRLLEADSLRSMAQVLNKRGYGDEADRLQQQARNLYRELGHRRGECQVLNSLASFRQSQSEFDSARELFLEALSLAREIGDRHSEGGLLSNLGTVYATIGDLARARTYHEEALLVRREIEDLRGQAISLGNLGVISGRQNDHTDARRRFEEALAIFREIGDRWGMGLTVKNLASVCLYLGDFDSANAYVAEAESIFRAIDYPSGVATAKSTLSLLLWLQSEYEESVAHCRRALEILEEIGELQHQPQVLIHLGDGLMGLNDISGAGDAFGQALELLRASGPEQAVVKPLAGLARVALAQGDPARALAHIEELLPHLATMDDPYHTYLTCYRVYQANDDARAEEILATAHRLLQENAALLSDEVSRRSFLENVRINREIVQEFAWLHSDT